MLFFILPELLATQAVGTIEYYFIFEMKLVKDKLDSEKFQDFKKKEKKTYWIRNSIMIIYSI